MYLSFSQQITLVGLNSASIPGVSVKATVNTSYSGNREIVTDFHQGYYRLRDYTRGNGIITLNLRRFADYNSAVDFTSETTNWDLVNSELDQYAIDVHWNTGKVYDFFLERFNRNSIDDKGFALYSYVHYGVEFDNAFWDGEKLSYGDGLRQPLTTLDLCGHEISHGVTKFTSGLSYAGESGALNEGFSDIMGTAIEQYARPENWDWKIGGDAKISRDLAHPKEFLQPDTYKGIYWYEGSDQNQFIHRNSSVLAYWFYLLSTGGSGKNDFGFNYSVDAIGIEKATAIAYYANTRFLFPDAGYLDAVNGSLRAAEMLYGEGSREVEETANAWSAVGLILKPTSPVIYASVNGNCAGSVRLSISAGNLNSGSYWKWYSRNCGETYLGTGDSLDVSPTTNTVYFARGEGPYSGAGPCASVFVAAVSDNTAPVLLAKDSIANCSRTDKQYVIPRIEVTDNCSSDVATIYYEISGATSRTGTGVDASGIFNTGTSLIIWRVADAAGNVSEARTRVVINACSDPWSQWANALTTFIQKLNETLQIKITAYPNPSNDYFKIVISGNSFSPVTIIVRDNTGRVIEVHKALATAPLELGRNYQSGIYFAEVIQGAKRVTVKLVRK
jgi:hypothetical protein